MLDPTHLQIRNGGFLKKDKPWYTFLPCIKDHNNKWKQLINVDLLIINESISGWFPNTSKIGGLPNCTLELR